GAMVTVDIRRVNGRRMRFRDIPLLKRVIPSARKRIAAITWPGGFKIVRRHGVLLLLNYRNYVDRELLFYGRYEREQIDVLTAAMLHHGCDIFLDVGANIGLYSLITATRQLAGEGGRVRARRAELTCAPGQPVDQPHRRRRRGPADCAQ